MLQLMIDATGNEETLSSSEDEAGEKSFGCPFYKKAGVLSDKDVVGHARVVLLAGYETISNTLAYTSYLLALNPDIQEKLQSEIDSYFDEKPVSKPSRNCIVPLLNLWQCTIIYRMLQLMKPAKRSHT